MNRGEKGRDFEEMSAFRGRFVCNQKEKPGTDIDQDTFRFSQSVSEFRQRNWDGIGRGDGRGGREDRVCLIQYDRCTNVMIRPGHYVHTLAFFNKFNQWA